MATKRSLQEKSTYRRLTPAIDKSVAINGCLQVFEDRLTLEATNYLKHSSMGLENDPTTSKVNFLKFQQIVDQFKKLIVSPGIVTTKGFQLGSDTSASFRRFVNLQFGLKPESDVTDPCCYVMPAPPQYDRCADRVAGHTTVAGACVTVLKMFVYKRA